MYKKRKRNNQYHYNKQQRIIRKTSSSQNSKMGKYSLTKRRHSHQSNILHKKQETTLILNKIEHMNSTTRLKHRTNTSSFRPLAASTPYDIEQSNSFNDGSPHSMMRNQRVLLTPPVCCSTPKQTRRQISNNNSHGRSTTSFKQKYFLEQHPPPIVPMISQRQLQFTPNSKSFVRYSNDDTKRINIKNIKIWLL